jgi:MFS family permease
MRTLLYLLGALGSGGFVLLQFLVPLWCGALGAPPAALGLIAGIGSLLAAVFTVPAGALVDRGKARPVLAGAALLAAAGAALSPLVPDYWWLVPLQLGGGLGRTVAWVAAQAYLIQTTPTARLARRTTLFSFCSNGGAFLAPVLGGLLVQALGYGPAFAFGAAVYLTLAALMLRLPAPAAAAAIPPWNLWHAYRRAGALLLRAGVLLLLAGTVLRLSLSSLRTSFFPVYLLSLAVDPGVVGLVVGAGNLSGVLATPLALRIQPRLGAGPFLFVALLGSAAAMLVTAYLQDVVALALVGLVWGMGIGISLPPLLALVARDTLPAERGLGTAVRNTGNEWSIMLSPIIFGQVAEHTGVADGFLVLGVVLLAGSAGGLVWARRLGEAPRAPRAT